MSADISERIKKILEEYGLSPSGFADLIKIQRSSMSHILSGRNNPSLDMVQKILSSFPELESDWLLIGRGPMKQLNLFGDEGEESQLPKKEKKEEKPRQELLSPSIPKSENPPPINQEEKSSDYEQKEESRINEKYIESPTPKESPKMAESKPGYEESKNQNYNKNKEGSSKEEPSQNSSELFAAAFGQPQKKVERIVIFYSDKTFSIYSPE